LISAQRPVSSSASSQRASRAGNSLLPKVVSVSMTVVSDSDSSAPPRSGEAEEVGHISATVSERSPT
jgi:hypothetical protein